MGVASPQRLLLQLHRRSMRPSPIGGTGGTANDPMIPGSLDPSDGPGLVSIVRMWLDLAAQRVRHLWRRKLHGGSLPVLVTLAIASVMSPASALWS